MASSGATSASFNIVMSSAIKGANFLQASVNGIYKYAKSVENIRLLKGTNFTTLSTKAKSIERTQLFRATRFGTLNKNVKTLDNHLSKMAIKADHIAKTPIKFDVDKTALTSARKDLTAMAKDSQTIFNYSKQTNRVKREGIKPTVTQQATKQRHSSFKGTSATEVVAKGFIAGTMLMPFRPAINFEAEMARVKALSRATPLEFKGLVTEAKRLGATTEWKATEVSGGMSYLSMAGFKPRETQQAMKGVLSLATAGKTDLATTSDIASNILSGFELKANKMDHVADVMARTITTSNTTVQMLGDTFKYVAPVSSKLGADLTEVATLTAKMGDVGIQGSQSGTALRAMYSRLSAPPKSAGTALASLGVETFNADGKFKGMIEIIGELKTALSSKTEEDKASYVKDIFGMEAMSGALAVMAVGKDKLLEYQETLKNSNGASKEIADIQLDTTAGQFKLLGSAMEGLSISVTSGLLPMVSTLTSGLTTITSGIQTLSESYPVLTSTILGGTAVIIAGGVALTAFGFASTMAGKGIRSLGFLKTITGRFSTLTSAIVTATAKQKAFNSLLSVDGWSGVPKGKTAGKKSAFSKVAKGAMFSTFPTALEASLPSVGKRRVKTTLARKSAKQSLVKRAMFSNTFSAYHDSGKKSTITKVAKGAKFSTVASNVATTASSIQASAVTSKSSKLSSIATTAVANSSLSATSRSGTFTKIAKGSKLSTVASFGTMGMKKNIGLLTRFNGLIGMTTTLLRGIGLALVGNPLGMAITAMVASGMLLYSKWEPIKAFFVGFGQGVSEALSPLAGEIKSVFSGVLSVFRPVATFAKKIFKWFGDITGASKWTKKELSGVASTGKKVGIIVGKAFAMAMTPVKLLLKAIQTVINAIGLVSKKIKTVMGNAKNAIVDKAKSVKDSVLSFVGLGEKKETVKKTATMTPVNNVITSKPKFKSVLDHKAKGTFKSSPFSVTAPGSKSVTDRTKKVDIASPLSKVEYHKPQSFNDITTAHEESKINTGPSHTSHSKNTDVSIGNISVAVHTQAKDLDADMVQAKVERALRDIKFDEDDLTHEDIAS